MGFNIVLLKLLCDRYIIPKLVSVKVQGNVMYFTKDTYNRLSQKSHKDDFIFDLSKITVGDEVLKMFKKFYIRPSKKVYKELVRYCEGELDREMLNVIFHNNILVIMDTLQNTTNSLLGNILNRN